MPEREALHGTFELRRLGRLSPVSLGRDYLEIVLRLARLVPGWVESYVRPSAVDEGQESSIEQLRESVQALVERVEREETERERRRWLLAQLHAIGTALVWHGGERPSYATLFQRCHGASVETVSDGQFEQAHKLLDCALPGRGDVAVRYRAWRDKQQIPREKLQAGIELLAREVRRRSRELFGLPDREQIVWELVNGEPWSGNAEYLGQRKTRIRINVDMPISWPRLLDLVCHEAYPGHHSENVCKDASLIQAAGREELSAYVYPTPQALISEGLATYALDAVLGDDGEEQLASECLRPAGISYDHETASVVRDAETLLLPVRSNIALMLDRGATSLEVRDYARAWLLEEPEQIDKAIKRVESRAWRPYESCYPVGFALCQRYAAGDRGRFQDLLHRQLTPADLT